ncbi:MAG: M23 family metallopeptidase [Sphingomonadales bacterium]|nr:M23 family metallopeptidase [Sphingomonadales bacterium]
MRYSILLVAFVATVFCRAQMLTSDSLWSLPMASPVELSAGFGDLRPNHFHMGIDLRTFGKENLPIYAIQDGFVSRMRVSSVGYGWVLYIDHPNGYTSVYAHCNQFAPNIQQFYLDTSKALQQNELDLMLPKNLIAVKKGELVALSGNTGGSSGPHLHFELRDTKTEHALNPFLHGFHTSDNGQPILSGVRIYAVDTNGYEIQGKSVNVVMGQNVHRVDLAPGFLSTGQRIAMAINVTDQFTPGGRSLGLFSAEIWTPSAPHFAFELDELDFEDGRYINAHHDFAYAQQSKKKYQKIFRSKSNPLTIYPYEGCGSFELRGKDSLAFSLMLRDVNGNESLHTIWVHHPGPLGPEASIKYNAQTHWLPNQSYAYKNGQWQILIDSLSFFEPTLKSLDWSTKRVGSASIQLSKPIQISYLLKDTAGAKQFCLTMNNKYLPTAFKDGVLSASSKTLGTFGLRKDMLAPTITEKTNNKLDSLNNGAWSWLVKDDFSGIASYSCWQNAEWVPAYYDAKNGLISAQMRIPFAAGTHIELRVKDAAGNERVIQRSTPLAPLR